MTTAHRRTLPLANLFKVGLLPAVAVAIFVLLGQAADHRDGPIFSNTAANGRPDLGDAFLFQAPGNSSTTVMALTVSPFPGTVTPVTFDQSVGFEIKVDNNGDAIEDITFRATFGAPDSMMNQTVTLRGLPSARFPVNGGILAQGVTNSTLTVRGGGQFFAGVRDDPFFFDAIGLAKFFDPSLTPAQKVYPRPRPTDVNNPGVNDAKNFFGPNVNTLALVLEVPTATLLSAPNNPNIGIWLRTERNGVQLDRTGRPAINTALIPPIPRHRPPTAADGDLRNAFNAGLPKNDRKDFKTPMMKILATVYGRNAADQDALSNFLLPDILTFNTTTAFTTNSLDSNGFPNGRRFRDAVIHTELNLLTQGAITTDNVDDDNGDLISDGTMRPNMTLRPILFPYMGPPHLNQPGIPTN